ncbi:MAG: RNA polymerase sigma factor [Clostridiales bacterium]|nr:RNA polymerase sigma factor [Clostridiales bacterium]
MDEKEFNKLLKDLSIAKNFNKLYSFYYPKIVSHIYFQFHNKNLGEDVAQDFFLKLLHKGVDSYIERPTAWVYTVCDNLAKDTLTKNKKYALSLEDIKLSKPDDTFETVLFGEYKDRIKTLDTETYDIIIMHYYEGYRLKEIAELLNINYSTVRQKCFRGLKKLKE